MEKFKPVEHSRVTSRDIGLLVDPSKVTRIGHAHICVISNIDEKQVKISYCLEDGRLDFSREEWHPLDRGTNKVEIFHKDLIGRGLYLADAHCSINEYSGDLYQEK